MFLSFKAGEKTFPFYFRIDDYFFSALWTENALLNLDVKYKNPAKGWKQGDINNLDPNVQTLQKKLEKELKEWFSGELKNFSIPLAPQGTAFQLAVWKVLHNIPYGKTLSYAEVAQKSGHPKAFRAAGGACGANPIIILIPCHRVLRHDKSLGGFSAGLNLKEIFHKIEKIEINVGQKSKNHRD